MAESSVSLADGDKFLLKLFPANKYRLFTMRRNSSARFGETLVKLDGLIGAVYGSTFEINRDGTLSFIEADKLNALERLLNDRDGDASKNVPAIEGDTPKQGNESSEKDNRNILQNSANQKISHEDLMKLKRSNAPAASIVSQLMANSSTFTEKNALTKAKYVRKKLAKHARFVQLLRVCARTVYAYYASKNRRLRVLGMRVDSAAQLLCKAGINPTRNVLLYDATCGFLTGCVIERVYVPAHEKAPLKTGEPAEGSTDSPHGDTSTQGKIVQVFRNSPLFPEWSPHSANEIISFVSIRRLMGFLNSSEQGQPDVLHNPEVAKERVDGSAGHEDVPQRARIESESGSESNRESSSDEEPNRSKRRKVDRRKRGDGGRVSDNTDLAFERRRGNFGFEMLFEFETRDAPAAQSGDGEITSATKEPTQTQPQSNSVATASEISRAVAVRCEMDSLIIAAKWPSGALIRTLLRFVKPGAAFVIYTPFIEAARDCFSALRSANCAAQLDLSETMYREWQVLSERTHPILTMDTSSGFIVSGFKLAAS